MSQYKHHYYTDEGPIMLREYGRNIHKLAAHLLTIEDREARTRSAHTLVELMRQLNPNVRDSQEYTQNLWDHLFIMTDFQLDVDSPFPMPEPSVLGRKPQRMDYPGSKIRYRHYGRNLQMLVEKVAELPADAPERDGATVYLGRLMKTFYTIWNKDGVDDEVIVEQLQALSRRKLTLSLERIKSQNLLEIGPNRPDPRVTQRSEPRNPRRKSDKRHKRHNH